MSDRLHCRQTSRGKRNLLSGFFRNSRGSLLLEAVIAVGVFAIFLAGIGLSLVLGERSTVAAGDRTRAVFLASQQLEAVREIRNRDFSLLTSGTHGVKLTKTGWSFSGSSILKNGYRSNVVLTTHDTDWTDVLSSVSWNFGNTRSGSVLFESSITNWQKTIPVGNWAAMKKIATSTESGAPEYQKIALSDHYLFISSLQLSGGKGLYIYDISNPAVPVRVATSFDLGASAYGIIAAENRLYIATNSPTQEVQVYDISSPATLSSSNLLRSIDLPGSGYARSIALYGNVLFIGSIDHPPYDQFTSVQTSETGPMTILDSLAMSGSVLDLSLQDGYAYVANSSNSAELQVVDIFNPSSLQFASGLGIDLPDVQDGNAIATFGTSALIGRLGGATIDELSLYSIADAPVPTPPPGPWTLEIGGDVNALASIVGSKYAFVGGSTGGSQLRVLDTVAMALGAAPTLKTYDAGATIRGLLYDWQHDRLYGVSPSSLFVFSPG